MTLAVIHSAIVRGICNAFGFDPEPKRCAQCYRFRPAADFIGARGAPVQWCAGCRERYRGWDRKTEAQKAGARLPVDHTGDGYTVRLTLRSFNRKTGPIPVSSTDMQSCPDACPHKDDGCYAGYGKAGAHWRKVARNGVPWLEFCAQVGALEWGTLWRHNEAGDLPGKGDTLDTEALRRLVRANRGRRGFTFTHRPLHDPDERRAIAQANAEGFTINLSADSLAAADVLADLRIAPVAVVLPSDAPDRGVKTPAGRTVVVCPAETHGLTCADCQLCAKQRQAVVGFRAHGQAKRRVSLRVVA